MAKKDTPYEPNEPVYTVLDPRSREPVVAFRGLNQRLDTLADKRIIVANLHGGNEEIMESVAADLKEAAAACDVVYYSTKGRWDDLAQEDWDRMLSGDAVILGHNY
ncbi:MAG: hypothetical protein JW896_03755 [Deltaproteobacteria bacterium]|nr:hypothetical protein [Deltaproteobacteria bacterium]